MCVLVAVAISVLIFFFELHRGHAAESAGLKNETLKNSKRPNIIIIISDDVGWNDFSLHGSNQIPTPNIDALSYNGVILGRFYTQSICTPSRAALLTGNYPIRSGMQGFPIKEGEDRFIPRGMPLLPEYLKRLGYCTHLVGKWHLGAARKRDTPTARGFDSHFGYWGGFIGYFNHMGAQEMPDGDTLEGLDFFDSFTPQWELQGQYTTDLFTERSLQIIEQHNLQKPLFLLVAHLAAHTGTNGTELGVPDLAATNAKYQYIEDATRRRYADIVNRMDNSVGRLVDKLAERHLLKNSIIVFLSDNGAQTIGTYQNSGSNWPLRGLKFNEFEGGIRGTATLYSPLLKTKSYINSQLFHISDFLPTLFSAAGGNVTDLGQIDGIDQWATLSENRSTARSELLTNLNEVKGFSALIGANGRFKLVNGSNPVETYEGFYGEDGRGDEVPPYDVSMVLESLVNMAICATTRVCLAKPQIASLRHQLDLAVFYKPRSESDQYLTCREKPCLFDLHLDPCETEDIFEDNRALADQMLHRLTEFAAQLVPQTNKVTDRASDPKNYNNTWCTWMDKTSACFKTSNPGEK